MKKARAALLDNFEVAKTYMIRIELSADQWSELHFSSKEMSNAEFQRLRSAGIYCGHWITKIEQGIIE
jgi:hypothetical protein